MATWPKATPPQAAFEVLDGHWRRADEEFRRAIELNPGWAHGQLMYAVLCLAPTGRLDEDLHQAMSAIELDPLNQTYRRSQADILYLRRDYQRAVEEYEQFPEKYEPDRLNPSHIFALDRLGRAAQVIPKLREGIGSASESEFPKALLGYLLARNDQPEEARKLLAELGAEVRNKTNSAMCPLLALVYIGLRDSDAAFGQLDLVDDLKMPLLGNLKSDPVFDPLRDDLRFEALLHRFGLDVSFPAMPVLSGSGYAGPISPLMSTRARI